MNVYQSIHSVTKVNVKKVESLVDESDYYQIIDVYSEDGKVSITLFADDGVETLIDKPAPSHSFEKVRELISGQYLTDYIPEDIDVKELLYFVSQHLCEDNEHRDPYVVLKEIESMTSLFLKLMQKD